MDFSEPLQLLVHKYIYYNEIFPYIYDFSVCIQRLYTAKRSKFNNKILNKKS